MRVLFVVLLLASPTLAQEPLRPVVPYSGQLDLNGQPYSGPVQMRFRLYTAGEGGEAECVGPCVWEEVHPAVQAYAGAFQVRLGAPSGEGAVRNEAIAQVVKANRQLWLEMALRAVPAEGEEGAEWVTLAQRQSIDPTPQTLWSADATDLTLEGLTVNGVTHVGAA